MNSLHEKSSCCRAVVRRFGGRRRQCSSCRKTWRVWLRRRGRHQLRSSPDLLIRYLRKEAISRYALARRRGVSVSSLRDRLTRSRDTFLARTTWPPLPTGEPLIAIADALVETFRNGTYTLYLILLRRVSSRQAMIAEPFLQTGTEVWQGWDTAFRKLPEPQRTAIRALVCDGHRGLLTVARDHRWFVQRCHFHLLASLQGRRSRWRWGRHREEGKRLQALVRHVLTTRKEEDILPALTALETLGWDTESRVVWKVVSGFLTSHRDYRTYIAHPDLCLPTTSNTVESLISSIRDLCYRARGFRTVESFTKWVHALLKLKRTVVCNGHKPSTKLPA